MNRSILKTLGAALLVLANGAFAANEIKYQSGYSIVSTKYGQSSQGMMFEVTVDNLGSNKQVFAHLNTTGAWIDVPLSYNHSISGNREVWRGFYVRPTNTVLDAEFALKYVVNGQTYWDNNSNQNYEIASDSGHLLASSINVLKDRYTTSITIPAADTNIYGGITVRDLAASKVVKVHYTTDNWATSSVANASFNAFPWSGAYSAAPNPNQYDSEEWTYTLNVGATATEVEYAIEYQVNGQTYWDNNTGLNYHTTIVRQ